MEKTVAMVALGQMMRIGAVQVSGGSAKTKRASGPSSWAPKKILAINKSAGGGVEPRVSLNELFGAASSVGGKDWPFCAASASV